MAARNLAATAVSESNGSPARRARVLVAEDNPFVRAAVVDLLSGHSELLCCGQVATLAATAQAVTEQKPDLLLLDLMLEDGEALGLIGVLKLQSPALAILVLSQNDETLYAQRVLEAGAQGYLMKEAAAQNLYHAIKIVLSGKTYLSPAMAARLHPRGEADAAPPHPAGGQHRRSGSSDR